MQKQQQWKETSFYCTSATRMFAIHAPSQASHVNYVQKMTSWTCSFRKQVVPKATINKTAKKKKRIRGRCAIRKAVNRNFDCTTRKRKKKKKKLKSSGWHKFVATFTARCSPKHGTFNSWLYKYAGNLISSPWQQGYYDCVKKAPNCKPASNANNMPSNDTLGCQHRTPRAQAFILFNLSQPSPLSKLVHTTASHHAKHLELLELSVSQGPS